MPSLLLDCFELLAYEFKFDCECGFDCEYDCERFANVLINFNWLVIFSSPNLSINKMVLSKQWQEN